jgi:antitoxin PrlF
LFQELFMHIIRDLEACLVYIYSEFRCKTYQGPPMPTTLTSKGQVTIPKQIRDALSLTPGCSVDFAVNAEGDVVIRKAGAAPGLRRDRFDGARGQAEVKWRTDNLMALLRGGG